ncbi:Formamidopyrimidine-DNA glycosylase [Anatilimnocola aggregata]|uniref:Formamidopyrimidine-DNA glycosylase n=1 Tax=Anatilimnocola aggregata TaxID=2528021 RepID=A0A517YBW8_9BACT|nr:bifunctional DNA-formamidopyrimidine glycosylase/DNA-(apurinic or apyrimidinic site) lyase [Anatilimnocola aggregata]QDU27669.1 Formamidopyrimidine-DNA glycosylase [Anatilimnocola aggregata]
MPELPEVETMRRGILGIVGAKVRGAAALPSPRKPIRMEPAANELAEAIKGKKVQAIDRLGKRVVVRLSGDVSLVFEPRMTGLVLVADPPSQEHLRFRLDLTGCPIRSVYYWDRRGLGSVRLVANDKLAAELIGNKLGPDALVISPEELQQRLGSSQRAIKVALLDQKAVAGVGNLYASEILHLAGIHPAKACRNLKVEDWQEVHRRLLEVLHLAIEHEGSTLSDGTYRNALNKAGGYQNQHRVYDRAGEPCVQCSTQTIIRIVQAQRATFFCPVCQPQKRKLTINPNALVKSRKPKRS